MSNQQDLRVALQLTNPGQQQMEGQPVTLGVPFPEGQVSSAGELRLADGDKPIAFQARPLARWPDGSIKWLLLDFQANIGAVERKNFVLSHGTGSTVVPKGALTVVDGNEGVIVKNNVLSLSLSKRRFRLFDSLSVYGRQVVGADDESDVVAVDGAGETYRASLSPNLDVRVEEAGPLRVIIKVSGSHAAQDGKKFLDYTLRYYLYANSAAFKVEHTFINRERPEAGVVVKDVHARVSLNLGEENVRLLKHLYLKPQSGYHGFERFVRVKEEVDLRIEKEIARGPTVMLANPDSVEKDLPPLPREVRFIAWPGNVKSWVDVTGKEVGVTTGIRWMEKYFPKGLRNSGGQLRYDMWPDWAGPLELPQGMAKTHELIFHFHIADMSDAERESHYEGLVSPLRPMIHFDWYQRCGVNDFDKALPYLPQEYPRIELMLRSLVVHSLRELHNYKWHNEGVPRGMLAYGDDVDPGYTAIYNTVNFGPPGDVWTNNEYDYLHTLVTQYCRTGWSELFTTLESGARHLIDVDHIHFSEDPYRMGGVPHHSVGHTTGTVFPSHMFTEGLLGYYCLTGNPAALETAVAIGENLLRWIEGRWEIIGDASREGGWALIALTSLYNVTGEERFLDGARKVAESYLPSGTPSSLYGVPPKLYGNPYAEGVNFGISIALMGLKRYHRASGDERIGQLLMEAIEYFFEHNLFPDGVSVVPMGLFLEPLAYVYDLTRDPRYAQAGMRDLRLFLDGSNSYLDIWHNTKYISATYRALIDSLKVAHDCGHLRALDYRD